MSRNAARCAARHLSHADAERFPSDLELLARAARSVDSRPGIKPRWSHVADVFAMGSTFSWALCLALDRDPEEQVGVADEAEGDDADDDRDAPADESDE